MEKHKSKKAKTLQIKYPLPYTQSWPNSEHASKHKKPALRTARKKHPTPPPQRCWPCGQARQRVPDPTVPHLKYGIFPKKTSLARGPSKTVMAKLSSRQPSPQENKQESNLHKETKKTPRQAQPTDTPILVFRALDKNSTRQLSTSETMHIDVKPRRYLPVSPLQRNGSPNVPRVRRNT